MKTRALPLLLSTALASLVLAGCGSNVMRAPGMSAAAKSQVLRARSTNEDPAPFVASANKAIALLAASPDWRNAKLVSIEGHGLDMGGRLVPLLGSWWEFKFWANAVEDGKMSVEFTRVDVVMRVEGTHEIVAAGESKNTQLERVLDPAKLAPPTTIVPFAIALGLKVNPAGPQFNYYDVTYNSFYADPSRAATDVADVTSYYQRETFDGLHIPARPELLPPSAATGDAPAAPVQGVARMSGQALSRETTERINQAK